MTYNGRPVLGTPDGQESSEDAATGTSVEPTADTDHLAEPVDLWGFLDLLDVYGHRDKMPGRTRDVRQIRERIARFAARAGDGATGTGVMLWENRIATEFGVDPETIRRHFRALVAAGFFQQTTPPARGFDGPGSGRKARYRCTAPVVDLGLGTTPSDREVSRQEPPTDTTSHPGPLSHQEAPADSWDDSEGVLGTTPSDGEVSSVLQTSVVHTAEVVTQLQDTRDAREAGVDDETRSLALLCAWAKVEEAPESWRQRVRQLLILDCTPEDVARQVANLGVSVSIPDRFEAVEGLLKKKVRAPWPAPAGSAKPE